MYSNPQQGHTKEQVLELRQEAGKYLKSLREAAKLSQRDLANAVGFDYYTFISQIEMGRGRVPPHSMRAFAAALSVPSREFAIMLMKFYDPQTYELIFGESEPDVSAAVPRVESTTEELAERIAKLEALLSKG